MLTKIKNLDLVHKLGAILDVVGNGIFAGESDVVVVFHEDEFNDNFLTILSQYSNGLLVRMVINGDQLTLEKIQDGSTLSSESGDFNETLYSVFGEAVPEELENAESIEDQESDVNTPAIADATVPEGTEAPVVDTEIATAPAIADATVPEGTEAPVIDTEISTESAPAIGGNSIVTPVETVEDTTEVTEGEEDSPAAE